MFLALVLHPPSSDEWVGRAVRRHWQHLEATGHVGSLAHRTFPGGSVYWDDGSTHAAVFERSCDDGSSSILVRGGYLAGEDSWHDALHSTELDSAWGEFGAVKATWAGNASISARAWSDSTCSWPIYVGERDSVTVASNDALLAGVVLRRTRIHPQSAYELLAYDHSLTSQTTIDGVQRLMPSESLEATWSPTGRPNVVRKKARRAYAYAAPERPARDRLPAIHQTLRDAVAVIPPLTNAAGATVQLSGGLDSRLTAAVLAEVRDERPSVVTLNLTTDAEVAIAAEVARILGYPHRVVDLREMDRAAARAGWMLTGGQVSVHAAAGNILGYQIATVGPDSSVMIVGAWPGDCLIGSYVPVLPTMIAPVLTPWALADWARKRGPMWRDRGIAISGRGARAAAGRALQHLREGLRGASGADAAQKISYWGMFVRQPTFSYVSPARLTSSVLEVTPLLARPYLEQLMTLTGKEILGKSFYRAFIVTSFPQLAHVAYASTGQAITDVPAGARWLPRSTDDVYHLLPAGLQSLARRIVAMKARRKASTEAPTSTSAELRFWQDFFDAEGVTGRVELEDVVIDATATEDIHVRSVSLALTWTAQYLSDAARELADET